MRDGGRTTERLGYLVKRAQQALRAALDAALQEVGVTTAQYAALAALDEEPGLSGAELARRCFVTAQTMNGIVVNLEGVGLVERRPHPEHGRILEVRLTPSGRAVLRKSHGAVARIEQRMTRGMSTAERDRLAAGLRRCVASLEGAAEDRS